MNARRKRMNELGGYSALAGAVLDRANRDAADSRYPVRQASALEWLMSDDTGLWARALGQTPDYIKRQARATFGR